MPGPAAFYNNNRGGQAALHLSQVRLQGPAVSTPCLSGVGSGMALSRAPQLPRTAYSRLPGKEVTCMTLESLRHSKEGAGSKHFRLSEASGPQSP